MTQPTYKAHKIAGSVLVALMAILQGIYAIYAYVDPASFATARGTELVAVGDMDWVRIYASRTLFVSLIIGYLLYLQNYGILKWAAIIGLVMPVTDGFLAYEAHASTQVILKHAATTGYLLATYWVLQSLTRRLRGTSGSLRAPAAPLLYVRFFCFCKNLAFNH